MITRNNTLAFLLFSSSIFAAETEFKNLDEKVSYLIGRNIGNSILQDGMEMETEPLLLGLREVLTEIDSQISEETAQELFSEFYERLKKETIEKREAFAQERLIEAQAFLAKNGKREGVTTTDSGLQYEIITSSEGAKPGEKDYVIIDFHGTLVNGVVFQSTIDEGIPGDLRVDQNIAGLEEILQLMPEGSKWKVYIPPALGFGKQGSGELIGPNEVLIYELELRSIQDFTKEDPTPTEEN